MTIYSDWKPISDTVLLAGSIYEFRGKDGSLYCATAIDNGHFIYMQWHGQRPDAKLRLNWCRKLTRIDNTVLSAPVVGG